MNERMIILASASPRRKELLEQIGVDYASRPVDIDESLRSNEDPVAHVQRLAMEKAEACSAELSAQETELPVLGADTIVELDGEVMGKPADDAQAKYMLTRLAGKSHCVHTAVYVLAGERRRAALSTSIVTFDPLTETVIDAYIGTGEPQGKAGAYAIQGRASQFVKTLHGSYSGVVGLPLYESSRLLNALGVATL